MSQHIKFKLGVQSSLAFRRFALRGVASTLKIKNSQIVNVQVVERVALFLQQGD